MRTPRGILYPLKTQKIFSHIIVTNCHTNVLKMVVFSEVEELSSPSKPLLAPYVSEAAVCEMMQNLGVM